ncbi:MAG: hypothetical protein WHV28_08710 [Bacteroidota bacterium]
MKKLLIIFCFIICSVSQSNSEIVLDRFTEDKFKPIIFAGIGWDLGQNADKFIELYNKGFGGNVQDFSASPTILIEYKSWIMPKLRLAIASSFVNYSYFDEFWTLGTYITRSHTNEISFNRIPILLKVEFIPHDKQFRSYAGAGVGALFQQTRWRETIRSNYALDKRVSSTLYNELEVIPGLNVYSGLELGFDEYPESFFLGSLIFQLDYCYFPKKMDIFKQAKKVLDEPSPMLNRKIRIFDSYFSFAVGLSFNLLNISKKQ